MARIARGSEPIRNAGGRQRLVALTFDDGPGPWTGQVLDTLKRLDVRATFYVQGTLVEGSEELLRRIVAEGHEIGVHGWAHADLTAADDAKVRHEVGDTRDAIRRFAGVDPLTMRPPYGAVDNRVRRMMAPYRLPIVLWDVDTRDWDGRTARTIRDETIASTSAGSIVLMHDGGSDRATTLAAVAPIVRALRAKRVEFVTVSELLMRDRAGGASGEGAGTPAGGAAGEADPTTGPAPDPASAGEEPAPGG